MKKVLIDANILDKSKIKLILDSGITKKLGHFLKFYVSEVLLKQRLINLFYSEYSDDYDIYINFIKNWCEYNIVDAAVEIVKREIDNDFSSTAKITSNFNTAQLYYKNEAAIQLTKFEKQLKNSNKIIIGNNFKKFLQEEKQNISKLHSSDDWENYCREFIARYKFAEIQLNEFLNQYTRYNKKVYFDLVSLWWKYTSVVGSLRFFNTPRADDRAIEIVNNIAKLPKKSFLYRQFKADEFILNYTLIQDKRFDYDSPNDVIYLSLMKNFDILLTDDQSFMKECFDYLYPNKNKQILTLNELIKRYK